MPTGPRGILDHAPLAHGAGIGQQDLDPSVGFVDGAEDGEADIHRRRIAEFPLSRGVALDHHADGGAGHDGRVSFAGKETTEGDGAEEVQAPDRGIGVANGVGEVDEGFQGDS